MSGTGLSNNCQPQHLHIASPRDLVFLQYGGWIPSSNIRRANIPKRTRRKLHGPLQPSPGSHTALFLPCCIGHSPTQIKSKGPYLSMEGTSKNLETMLLKPPEIVFNQPTCWNKTTGSLAIQICSPGKFKATNIYGATMTYQGWKDNQDHEPNIKEFNTEYSECTNYMPNLEKQMYSKHPISVL